MHNTVNTASNQLSDEERSIVSVAFDRHYYLERYVDIANAGIDPVEHYIRHGAREGRNPSPEFDTKYYVNRYPDVRQSGMNPFYHWLKFGRAGGRTGKPDIPETKPAISAEELSIVSVAFDRHYYLERYVDIANAGIDPVEHYIRQGAREGRNPSPEFDTKYYLNRYPDVRQSGMNPFYHWLKFGRARERGATPFSAGDPIFNSLCDSLNQKSTHVESELGSRRRDLRDRLEHGALGKMVAKASELEPLINQSRAAAMEAQFAPFISKLALEQMLALHRLHVAAGFRQARMAIAIRACRISGAARIAGHLANALAHIYGAEEVIIVRTDQSDMLFPEWFPGKCRHVDFALVSKGLPAQERKILLVEFLRSLRPEAVFNVNSRLLWDALKSHGKALASSIALYAYLFCNDRDIHGRSVGYPNAEFYRHFDIVKGFITDSAYLADVLRARFLVPPDQAAKLVTLHTPVANAPLAQRPPSEQKEGRPQIFWAGRFDRQKRMDIAYAVAKRLPEIDFRMWGEPVLDDNFIQLTKPDNVTLEGLYRDLSELPFESCDLWLYTSGWDGVPNILIEVTALGVPVVASVVGGVAEVLVKELSQRVENIEDVEAYVTAICAVLANPRAARQRAEALRKIVLAQRSAESYRADVQRLLSRSNRQ